MPHAIQDDVRLWQWSRSDYYRAAELGLFDPDDHLELLEGEIIQRMSPHKTTHSTSVLFTQSALAEIARKQGCHIRAQLPITLNDRSEPEPDVQVILGTIKDYAYHHPAPAEIRLLIEVSDSTLLTDRGRKALAYAREGINDYWIINLIDRQLEVFRDPGTLSTDSDYKPRQILHEGDTIAPCLRPKV